MKNFLLSILFTICSVNIIHAEQLDAHFNRDCEAQILNQISKAKKQIKVAMYSFTRFKIARALMKAQSNGVDVQVIVDSKQAETEYGSKIIQFLINNGIKPKTVLKNKGHMHHKFTIIDNSIILTGSYNFSTSAANLSDECLLIIKDKNVAQKFLLEWQRLLK